MLHWREDEFRGVLSINMPLITVMNLFVKPLQWDVAVGK